MSGKRNVPVCRGHELANALYNAVENDAILISIAERISDIRIDQSVEIFA